MIAALRDNACLDTVKGGRIGTEWLAHSPIPLDTLPRAMAPESSNTMVVLGSDAVGKILRAPLPGPSPEVEIGTRLTQSGFIHAPGFLGHMRYIAPNERSYEIALFSQMIRQGRDLWSCVQEFLVHREYDRTFPVLDRVGVALADLHRTLAAIPEKAFEPEPVQQAFISSWIDKIRSAEEKTVTAPGLAHAKEQLKAAFNSVATRAPSILADARRIRQHGDFHLGQALRNPQGDVFLIDFEGEVLASPEERRQKHLPLKDAAGLVRSLHYASHAAVLLAGAADHTGLKNWYAMARTRFLDSYFKGIGSASFLPSNPWPLLQMLEFEKALYELQYEIQNRPQWIQIPLEGILAVSSGLSV